MQNMDAKSRLTLALLMPSVMVCVVTLLVARSRLAIRFARGIAGVCSSCAFRTCVRRGGARGLECRVIATAET
jgi:hypothetical protein